MRCTKSKDGKHQVATTERGDVYCFFCGEDYHRGWNDGLPTLKSNEEIVRQTVIYEEELTDIQAYSSDASEQQRARAYDLHRSIRLLRWVLGFEKECPK